MSNQNSLFCWGLPPVSCSDDHWNTDTTHPGGAFPFGQTFVVSFQNCSDPSSPPFVLLWDSEDPGRVQPCWAPAEFSGKHVETSQESGTWRRRRMLCLQLIHLVLRRSWPTNYLSKGHSQAPRGFCSFCPSEGKMSPKKPCNSQLGTGLWVRVSEPYSSALLDTCFQWSDLGQGMP